MVQIGPMAYSIDVVNKKVLWERNLLDDLHKANMNFNILPDGIDGSLQIMSYGPQPFTRKIGQIGTLQASYVCLQTQKGLVAVDPVTGKELWTKSDVPARTQIFGDEQHIYLIEPAGGQTFANARCLRASDGVRVDVPDFAVLYQARKRVLGRNLLVEEKTKELMVLRLYDIHTGKDLWKKTFEPNAKYLHSPDEDLAGVIERDGKITAINLRTSKEILSAKLEGVDIKDLKDPLILDDGNQVYVALNKPVEATVVSGGVLLNNFATGTHCATVNGIFYAFDRKGKMRWHSMGPIANQLVVLEHFKDMPIIIFTARYNWMANGNQVFAFFTSLDKKTGKLVWNPDPRSAGNYQLTSLNLDAGKRTIELTGFNGQKTVQFYVEGHMPKDDGKKAQNYNQPQPRLLINKEQAIQEEIRIRRIQRIQARPR
jgi:outer membrane protein assembly factor BamB